jgi:hypothetical protein
MRLRLLALSLVAAAASAALPAAQAGPGYTRECGGTVDVMCWEWSCRAVDCFRYDCEVYVNPHSGGATICVI